MTNIKKEYDLVVVGGGLSGICAAIAAARKGLKTALVQNRSVLGGNSSSEIRVHVNGAGRDGGFRNAIESGIILELLMANKKVNPQYSYSVWDNILWEKTYFQKNLDLYTNTQMISAKTENNTIKEVICVQSNTETEFTFSSKLFADTTGDATLAYLAGAEYTIGREAAYTYNEDLAVKVADKNTMGSTILFSTKDMDRPVKFKRPDWAYEFTEEMLASRKIFDLHNGYWWMELGDENMPTIKDGEFIKNELLRYIYGLFDYIKNSGKYEADNLALDWIGVVPGKRESRRVYGDYVLNQNDIDACKRFDDAIAYGGWTMDDHSIGGLKATGKNDEGTVWHDVKDVYTIPYRCIYSKNINNLYVGGRAISASHMALSSTRVMATCAVIGQAIGTAAAFAIKDNISIREVGSNKIKELQQELIHDDCYIPGIVEIDSKNVITKENANFSASSFIPTGKPENINGDYARRIDENEYAWISNDLDSKGEWIQIDLKDKKEISNIYLRFDPNFSKTIIPTQAENKLKSQVLDMPLELVKEYKIEIFNDNKLIKTLSIDDNFQRVNSFNFEAIKCDSIKITVLKTYGDNHARIFTIKAF